jgi:hypothetical protein
MALLTSAFGTTVLIVSLRRARSRCFSVISLLVEVVTVSDVVLGGVTGEDESLLAVSSLLDEVVIEADIVLGGVSGEDESLLAVSSLLE